MMPVAEAVRMAFFALAAQKLKTFFSLLGVMVGVMFMIAIVSIIQGMNRYVEDQVANKLIGLNAFQIRRFPQLSHGNVTEQIWREWMRRPMISPEDASDLWARFKTPVFMARSCQRPTKVRVGSVKAENVFGAVADADYFRIKNLDFASGRPFGQQEVNAGSSVVVIGMDIVDEMFKGLDPLGRSIVINDLPHRIVGVVVRQGKLMNMSLDNFVVTPFNSPLRRQLCENANAVGELHIQAASIPAMTAAMNEAEDILRSRRQLRPNQNSNFAIENADDALSEWRQISRMLFLALPALVGISVVVGGIIIMNIMLMSVTQRIQEIGVRKAMGARRKDILRQFIVEAATVSTLGAVLGIALGLGLAFLVDTLTPFPAAVAPWSIVIGVTIGVVVGMVAGVYPASRAARLDPIEALRVE